MPSFQLPAPDSLPSMCSHHVQPCATHPCVMHPCAPYMHPCAIHHVCPYAHHQVLAPNSTKLNQSCIRQTPRPTARVLYPVRPASVFRGAFKFPSADSTATSVTKSPSWTINHSSIHLLLYTTYPPNLNPPQTLVGGSSALRLAEN